MKWEFIDIFIYKTLFKEAMVKSKVELIYDKYAKDYSGELHQ